MQSGHHADRLLQPHGVALAQSAGNASPSLVQNKTPAEARQQQGLADKGTRLSGGAPDDPPSPIQLPQLGSSKLTHSIVLQISASDAVVLEK